MQNAIHMLKSVTNTIGDSFIITTSDGKVIVIRDGGELEITANPQVSEMTGST